MRAHQNLPRPQTPLLACALGNRKREQVPPKIRELIKDLKSAGFADRGGKGSHRNYAHPNVARPVTISGSKGDDAKQYQIRAVKMAIEESKQ